MFAIVVTDKAEESLVKLDCSQENLDCFLQQYSEGEIVFRGKSFLPDQIDRVEIFEYHETTEQLIDKAERELNSLASLGVMTLGIDSEVKAAYLGNDVTDKFITKSPGHGAYERQTPEADHGRVFVVHGHDRELKVDVERFLFSVGLEPIVLHRQTNGGKTVIEKFEEHSNVKYAFILLTPDDLGCTARESQEAVSEKTYTPRARQNVIFEWGFFTAKLGRQGVCVLNKGVEVPSDLAGLIYESIREHGLDPIEERLKNELLQAGLTLRNRNN